MSRVPGTQFRLVENLRRMRLHLRHNRVKDPTGLKRYFIPGTEFEGTGVLTPYARKEMRKRRAARRVSHESRRRNRARSNSVSG